MSDTHDATYYGKCMAGGILSCGLTHTAVVTMDLIKCRRQVDPTIYRSLGDGFNKIKAAEGFSGLTVGWAPTFVGYGAQGFGKFGFYEIFKDVYAGIVGKENAAKYQTTGFLVASACAEVIADTFLCPFEAIKVRMQTDMTGTFPRSFGSAWNHVMQSEGWAGMYKGLVPLWCRQVPYTMVKFAAFERTVRYFYSNIMSKPKSEYSKATQLMITFLSGYWAGIFCAIVSHPADTMVSKINNVSGGGSVGSKVAKIYSEIGFSGLWSGLMTRILMVGTLTGLQWWIYDTFKVMTGLQASGGK
jgi:solute carrier family 25 phosphate transporter 3